MQEQQNDCKRQRWLRLDTKFLQKMLDEQLQQVSSLPPRSHSWDVHIGMLDSIIDMQVRHFHSGISDNLIEDEMLYKAKFDNNIHSINNIYSIKTYIVLKHI